MDRAGARRPLLLSASVLGGKMEADTQSDNLGVSDRVKTTQGGGDVL